MASKRVGIVTFHRAMNYGAVLQAYALQQYIQAQGCTCEIVDYRSEQIENTRKLFPLRTSSLKKFISGIANVPVRIMRKKAFSEFQKEHLKTGEAYTKQNIRQANLAYDGFFFGSDQIWNHKLSGSDLNYFGAFVSQTKKRFAYAASFGEVAVPEMLKSQYAEELAAFSDLSVREACGKERVEAMVGKAAQIVVDPVFLLGAKHWRNFVTKNKNNDKYILLYHLQGDNTKLMRYAQFVSKATGYKIVEFQAWANFRPSNIKPVFGGSPEDFLNMIHNAEYVITDSFHCTAFSVIFEKVFWTGMDSRKDPKETRSGNLLISLGLRDRILPTELETWDFASKPEFVCAKEKLKAQVAASAAYIDSALKKMGISNTAEVL